MKVSAINAFYSRERIITNADNTKENRSILNCNTTRDLFIPAATNFKAGKTEEIRKTDNNSRILMQTEYPYKSETLKDDYTALCTTMMLIFLTGTFHSEKSGIMKDKNGARYNLVFVIPKDSEIHTAKDGYKKQQELFKTLYENDYTPILDGIKQNYKEILDEDYRNNKISESEKLKYEEVIDSIEYKDIKTHIKKYLLDATPEIRENSAVNNPTFNGKIKQVSLPKAAFFPVIVCMSVYTRTQERNKKIVEEALEDRINKPVTERTIYNTKKLKECGIKDKDIEKYLKYDGHPTDEGEKILKEHHKSFKGGMHNDEIRPLGDDAIPITDVPENANLDDLMNVDTSLPDELQEIVDIPAAEVDSDLVSDIMADLPDGFEPDADLLENLRGLTGEILDMLG